MISDVYTILLLLMMKLPCDDELLHDVGYDDFASFTTGAYSNLSHLLSLFTHRSLSNSLSFWALLFNAISSLQLRF